MKNYWELLCVAIRNFVNSCRPIEALTIGDFREYLWGMNRPTVEIFLNPGIYKNNRHIGAKSISYRAIFRTTLDDGRMVFFDWIVEKPVFSNHKIVSRHLRHTIRLLAEMRGMSVYITDVDGNRRDSREFIKGSHEEKWAA